MGVGLFGKQSKKGTGEKRALGHREQPSCEGPVVSRRAELAPSTAWEPPPPDRGSPSEDRLSAGFQQVTFKCVHSTSVSQVGINWCCIRNNRVPL